MDYEKKYNEALKRAKAAIDVASDKDLVKGVASTIFPELRESEDERIRQDLIGGLMWQRDNLKSEGPHDNNLILPGFCLTVGKHLAYLEKQKEEKQNATEKLSEVLKDFAEGYRRVLKKKGIDYIFSDEFFKGSAVCYSKQEDVEFQKWYKDLMFSEEKQKEQEDKELSEKIAAEYQLGRSDERTHNEQNPVEHQCDCKYVGCHVNDCRRYCHRYNGEIPYEDCNPNCGGYSSKHAEKQDYSGLNDFERAIHRGFLCAGVENVPVTIIKETAQDCLAHIKPVDFHIDNPNIQKFDPDVKVTTIDSSESGKELLYVSNKSYDIGFRDGVASVKPVEWGEEDEKLLNYAISMTDDAQVKRFLKSLRPQKKEDLPRWKKWNNGACGNGDNFPIALVKVGCSYALTSCLGINGQEYIMLSDLEKLPKEDEK